MHFHNARRDITYLLQESFHVWLEYAKLQLYNILLKQFREQQLSGASISNQDSKKQI
jgi:hypothetical protein